MGFIRKLFGKGGVVPTDKGQPSERDHDEDDKDDEEDEDDPASEDGQRRYLEFVGGTSAKFYAVVLHADEDGDWSVAFNFGRIGTPRDWAHKVEGADLEEATEVYDDLIAEKERKGYQTRTWPATLRLPEDAEGGSTNDADQPQPTAGNAIFLAPVPGTLPAASGGRVAGIALPSGRLFSPEAFGGSRGPEAVLWVSDHPMERVGRTWASLAAAFAETGLWPLIVDADRGLGDLTEILIDVPRGRPSDPAAILRRWWTDGVVGEDGEYDEDANAPFGRRFPGLAPPMPGDRPASIDDLVRDLTGHLGLVAVRRPGDVLDAIGWSGAANYDADPSEQSTVLRSWEDRFDAYLVGLGFDVITVAVARPPRDRSTAIRIAAEHAAFCPDNISQGVGTIREYADALVKAPRWDFWWD